MFKSPPKTTFADAWYRVAETRPRLSPHATIVRQIRRGRVAYILEEPASGNYYRISEPAYFFLGFLDGRTSVDEAWDACNAQLGDDAPTQRECIDVLSKLQLFGLLLGEMPLNAEMIGERRRRASSRRLQQRTGMWVFPNVPLIDPERFLERHRDVCRLLFSKTALLLWLGLVLTAFWFVLRNADRLGTPLQNLLAPSNLIWMAFVFLCLRAIHEFGHAISCKAFGGRVTEIGVILIAYVLPLPYCDATSSWRFPSTLRRVIVSSGGMLAETVFAAIAAIVWATTREGALVHTLSYNVMIISGFTTFLFNLNPLLRYDGYYILSDAADSPNLAQRARDLWMYLIQRYAFGVKALTPPHVRDRSEGALMLVYHALAVPYRLIILFAIGLVVATKYPGIGVLLVAVMVAMSLVWPLLKGVGFLASSPVLAGHRGRAIGVSVGALVVAGCLIGLTPAPSSSYAVGQVLPRVRQPLRTEAEGYIEAFLVREGERVEAGQPIMRIRSPEAEAELVIAEARVGEARVDRARAARESPGAERMAQLGYEKAVAEAEHAREVVERLTVVAPAPGAVVSADPTSGGLENLLGRYAQRGTLVASIVSTDEPIVRVAIPDRAFAWILEQRRPEQDANAEPIGPDAMIGQHVEIRLRGDAGRLLTGRVVSAFPAASRNLQDPALSALAGGEIMLDPSDPKGERALNPFFIVEVRPDELPSWWQPGLRARVRFPLEPTPLLKQWYRLGTQYFRARLG